MELKSRNFEINIKASTTVELKLTDSILILFGPTPEDVKIYIPGDPGNRIKITDAHVNVKTVREGELDGQPVVELGTYERFTVQTDTEESRPAQKIGLGLVGQALPDRFPFPTDRVRR